MRIHLAGSPAQVEADVRVHLAGSGMYHHAVDRGPDDDMRVHLVSSGNQHSADAAHRPDADRRIAVEAVNRARYPYQLMSFAYTADMEKWRSAWRHHPCTVMIDSGAFTAYTLGKKVSLAEYAQFVRKFPEMFPYLVETHFVSLDVIGDQAATWTNYRRLVARGCEVLPVVTFGSPMDDVRRAAAAHPYICLGGLVGRGNAALDWLDQVFDVLTGLPELPRTHLLGVSSRRALLRYPAFSSDASSWLGLFRYGAKMAGRNLPRYATSPAASAAARLHMQNEVRKIDKLMRDATAFWTQRGVTWPTT